MTNRFAGQIEADAPLALAIASDVEAWKRREISGFVSLI
jgi:hypothetical protein